MLTNSSYLLTIRATVSKSLIRRAWNPLPSHATMRSCSSSLSSKASRASSSALVMSIPDVAHRFLISSTGKDSQRVTSLHSASSSGRSRPASAGHPMSSTYHSRSSASLMASMALSCLKSSSHVSPSSKRAGGIPCASHSRVTRCFSSRRAETAMRELVKGTSYFRHSSRNSSSGRYFRTRTSLSLSTRAWASMPGSKSSPSRRYSARSEERPMIWSRSSCLRTSSARSSPRRPTGTPRASRRSARPRTPVRRSKRLSLCISSSSSAASVCADRP
mmetsp:Transcript_124337/g.363071  ORF Transcript_124337/g.363071 Transcript_124337/m.363071 type:complete len:275 (-) Transcript_124337:1442-2266(-)